MTTYAIATSPGKFCLTLPIVTVSEANQHRSFRLAAKRKAEQRKFIANWIGRIHRESLPPAPADVLLVRIGPKLLDTGDNLPSAFKAIRDEIAKIYGVSDAANSPLTFAYDQEPTGTRDYAVRVEITSRQASASSDVHPFSHSQPT